MTDELIFEEGERFNLVFNKRVLKGWLLVLTKNDKEYLIKQNFIIMRIGNYRFKRKYYQVNSSLKSYIYPKEKAKKILDRQHERRSLYFAIGTIVSSLVRYNIDNRWFYGDTNAPPNITKGISNIAFFWFFIFLYVICMIMYRDKRMIKFLKRNNKMPLTLIGIGQEDFIIEEKINKVRVTVAALILMLSTLLLLVIFPFFLELRFLGVIIGYLLIMFYFNCCLLSDNRKSKYIIKKIK